MARQTERVATQGGTGAPAAEPSLNEAFQLSLKGLCLEITLGGKKTPSAGCLGVKPGSFKVIAAITAILLYPARLSKMQATNRG